MDSSSKQSHLVTYMNTITDFKINSTKYWLKQEYFTSEHDLTKETHAVKKKKNWNHLMYLIYIPVQVV